MKKIYLLALIVIFVLEKGNAQTARKYSNEFLNIGVDAAAFGMGKSVVATVDNVNASYWNPAGLVNVKSYEGALMHAEYFAGIAKYEYAAFAMPIDEKSSLGISIIRFAVDDILNTTALIDNNGNIDYNRIQLFSAADYAFQIGYARQLGIKNLTFGANAKIIRRTIGKFANSWGFGLDASLQYQYKKWQFGLMARDITTTFNAWAINKKEFAKISGAIPGKNQTLPQTIELTLPKVQLGFARNFDLNKGFHLLSEIDMNFRFAQTNDLVSSANFSFTPSAGVQADFNQIVFLRAGVGNFQNIPQPSGKDALSMEPSFGVGFKYKGIGIDYALTNIGSVGNVLYSNVFSIKFNLSEFKGNSN